MGDGVPPAPAQSLEAIGTVNVLPRVKSEHHDDKDSWGYDFSDLTESSGKVKCLLEAQHY